jgi:hypothetical protein
MSWFRNNRTLLIGFLLVLAGVVIPFITIMGLIPSNMFVLFASYAGSVVGVVLALLWAAGFVRDRRQNDRDEYR